VLLYGLTCHRVLAQVLCQLINLPLVQLVSPRLLPLGLEVNAIGFAPVISPLQRLGVDEDPDGNGLLQVTLAIELQQQDSTSMSTNIAVHDCVIWRSDDAWLEPITYIMHCVSLT
jgi:hypothetical protein